MGGWGGGGQMFLSLNSNIDDVGPCRLVVTFRLSFFDYNFFFVEPGRLNTVCRSRIISNANDCHCLGGISQTF